MKGKASYTIIIISLLIQAFFYMFVITGDSGSTYDKYESGEYYLRARAYTTDFELTNDNALQYSELDMSDPKNMLLCTSNADVFASDPKGPYCTVVYGENTINDFPLSRLKFKTDYDRDIFNGKKYTREEYDALMEVISKDPSMKDMLSDENMLPGKPDIIFPLVVLGASVVFCILFYVGREDEMFSEIMLVAWVLLSIFWDICYVNIF
jgi:hypothetical protein